MGKSVWPRLCLSNGQKTVSQIVAKILQKAGFSLSTSPYSFNLKRQEDVKNGTKSGDSRSLLHASRRLTEECGCSSPAAPVSAQKIR